MSQREALTPRHPVKLPDGSTYEITVTWTPDTCAYQAYESLGGDPFLREALRQQIMIYQAQASRTIEEQLTDQVAEWSTCVGNEELTSEDLLRVVVGGRLRTDVDPTRARTCLSDDMAQAAVETRADAELALATEDRQIVEAWINVLEQEAAAAGSS